MRPAPSNSSLHRLVADPWPSPCGRAPSMRLQHGEVGAAGKAVLARGDDRALDRGVAGDLVDDRVELVHHLLGEDVHRAARHVPGDERDAVGVGFDGEIRVVMMSILARSSAARDCVSRAFESSCRVDAGIAAIARLAHDSQHDAASPCRLDDGRRHGRPLNRPLRDAIARRVAMIRKTQACSHSSIDAAMLVLVQLIR